MPKTCLQHAYNMSTTCLGPGAPINLYKAQNDKQEAGIFLLKDLNIGADNHNVIPSSWILQNQPIRAHHSGE